MTQKWRRALLNLLLIPIFVVPFWIILWLLFLKIAAGTTGDPKLFVNSIAFWVILTPPILLGGIFQQILVQNLPLVWSPRLRRTIGGLSGLIFVPVGFIIVSWGDPGFLFVPPLFGTLLASLIIYALIIRIPK